MTAIEKRRIRRELKRIFQSDPSGDIESALERSAPLRGRLLEDESADLLGKAIEYGVVPVDLMPFRFNSPMWLEEGGHKYLSHEAKGAIGAAIKASRSEMLKLWQPWLAPIAAIISAICALIAILKH